MLAVGLEVGSDRLEAHRIGPILDRASDSISNHPGRTWANKIGSILFSGRTFSKLSPIKSPIANLKWSPTTRNENGTWQIELDWSPSTRLKEP